MKWMERRKEVFSAPDTDAQKKTKNRSYQEFYEDHADYAVPVAGRSGKKIVHVYQGEWHRIAGDEKSFRQKKGLYALLFALSAACLFAAFCCDAPAYREKPVALLQFLDVLCMGWTLVDLISYWLAKYRMTIYMYKSISLLRAAAALSGIAIWLTGMLVLLYTVLPGKETDGKTVLCFIAYACSGIFLWILGRMERKTSYVQEDSEEVPPVEAVRIK